MRKIGRHNLKKTKTALYFWMIIKCATLNQKEKQTKRKKVGPANVCWRWNVKGKNPFMCPLVLFFWSAIKLVLDNLLSLHPILSTERELNSVTDWQAALLCREIEGEKRLRGASPFSWNCCEHFPPIMVQPCPFHVALFVPFLQPYLFLIGWKALTTSLPRTLHVFCCETVEKESHLRCLSNVTRTLKTLVWSNLLAPWWTRLFPAYKPLTSTYILQFPVNNWNVKHCRRQSVVHSRNHSTSVNDA